MWNLLLDEYGEPMVYISRDTADMKASVIGQKRGVRAKVRALYYRGEMRGYVIRVKIDVNN